MGNGRRESIFKRVLRLPYRPITRRVTSLDETLRTLNGQVAGQVGALSHDMHQQLDDIHANQARLERLARRSPWMELIGAPISQLDGLSAAFLNYAEGDFGFAAQRGLPQASPLALGYAPGQVDVISVNSQIVEAPFVYRSLAPIPIGSEVFYTGDPRSIVPLALAAAGYKVRIAVAPAYALSHPNLSGANASIGESSSGGPRFAAAIAIWELGPSSLAEYFGAMSQIGEIVGPEACLVLIARFNADVAADFRDSSVWLDGALGGWDATSTRYARQAGASWEPCDQSAALSGRAVALVTGTRPASSH